jgi:hypothetical protein
MIKNAGICAKYNAKDLDPIQQKRSFVLPLFSKMSRSHDAKATTTRASAAAYLNLDIDRMSLDKSPKVINIATMQP